MRVLMVQTPSVEGITQERVYPIGIVSLATHLKGSGHEVELLDMNLELDPYGALKQRLTSFQPEAVGLSLRNIDPLANKTSSLVPPFVVVVRLIAALRPQAWLIAGGTGFSLFPERLLLELPEIHFGIVGEAERSYPALLAYLTGRGAAENKSNSENGRPQEGLPPIKGLCMREGREVRVMPPARDYDMMADYVPPDRGILDPAVYAGINNYVPAVGIETKRGCSVGCTYCVYPRLQGSKLRCRLPVAVVDEVELLHKEYGIACFHFNDPVLNTANGHLEEICRELLRRKLKVRWDGFMREDQLDAEKVALYEKAGCECFSFSPDGLCQESLDVLGKKLTEEDVLKAAGLVAQSDVMSVYHFMVNVPGETEKTCEKGIRMLEQIYELHSRKKNLGTVVLNNIRILPGTPIEAMARAEGVIGPDTDLLYPVYYNPKPFDTFRYRLETLQLCKNIFMWQDVM